MSQERRYEKCGSCGAVVENPEKCEECGKNLCVSCIQDCSLTVAALGVKDAITLLCRAAGMSGMPDADETIENIFDSINNLDQRAEHDEHDEQLPFDQMYIAMLTGLQNIATNALAEHERREKDTDSDG